MQPVSIYSLDFELQSRLRVLIQKVTGNPGYLAQVGRSIQLEDMRRALTEFDTERVRLAASLAAAAKTAASPLVSRRPVSLEGCRTPGPSNKSMDQNPER
jgi:hypothetical protein